MVYLHKIKVVENSICNLECGRILRIRLTVLEISSFKDLKPWSNFGGPIGPEGTLYEYTSLYKEVFKM